MMKVKISCTIMLVMLTASVAWGKDDVMSQAQSIFKPVPAKPPVLKGALPTPCYPAACGGVVHLDL